jgi:hypothetical protein
MEIDKDELRSRTVWRKHLVYQDMDVFIRDAGRCATVLCVREVSGYAVWYRRFLNSAPAEGGPASTAQLGGMEDGTYLLGFFEPRAKHEAIEFAVMATMPGAELAVVVAHLDSLAKGAMLLRSPVANVGPYETIQ